jgi:hypothetical protein
MQAEAIVNQSNADVNQVKQEVAKFESALKAKEDETAFLRPYSTAH